jgi:1-deoxy-D-xylulose-5-phosphate synthase
MAYEAMNCAGYLKQRMIVILNDNGQVSLPTGTPSAAGSQPVGALSASSTRALSSRPFLDARAAAKSISKLLPDELQKITRKVDEIARSAVSQNEHSQLWEELGFYYLGPIDGHDLDNLVPILENLRDSDSKKPVLLHIKTEKGRGYVPALKASDRMHGVAQFDISTGVQKKGASGPPTYTSVFSTTLCELARQDPTVVGITAAMPGGTGLDVFGKFFPKRTFDVGIAEQHAVTFAAGMAVEGLKPFCAIYSTFLQRGYDQVVHDCVIQSLPVRFMIDRAGLVGNDGPTHHGCFDLAYLGCLPNIVVMAPADEIEMMRMMKTAWAIDDKPSAVRYPRGNGYGAEGLNALFGYSLTEVPGAGEVSAIPVGKGRIIRKARADATTKVALLTIGTRLEQAVRAAQMIQEEWPDVGVTVADARFMKPLDTQMIRDLVSTHSVLVTAEEGSVGGFGEHVMSFLLNEGMLDDGKCRMRTMVIPDNFIEAGGQKQQYDVAGLTAKHIASTALKALDKPGLALNVLAKGPAVMAGEAPTVA